MARRLALLLLLACAVAAGARVRRPTPAPRDDYSDSDSTDPFAYFDDYESLEPVHMVRPTARPVPRTTPRPLPRATTKSSAKVIIRAKGPKVNTTTKNTRQEDKKKVVKTTTINIESYTNLIVTEKPPRLSVGTRRPVMFTHRPMVVVEPQYVWVDEDMETLLSSSRRPIIVHRRPSTRRTTTQTPTTTDRATTTRRASTTRRRTTTTKPKTDAKKTTCPPKNTAWLSTFFAQNKNKKANYKKTKQGWFSGLFTRMYKWIWGPSTAQSSGWFDSGSWFPGDSKKTKRAKPTTTTTTESPVVATTANWFQNLLNSEEEDAYTANETKKSTNKKSAKKTYKGYQLLRTYPDVQWKVHEMLDLKDEAEGSGLMWWTQPSINGSTDLLVPPDLLSDIKDHLKSLNVDFDVIIWDLQKAIMYENPKLSKKQRMELEQLRGHPMTWRRYHRYADMLRYLEYIQHSYADIVELIPLGRSSEGLPLVVVKISIPENETKKYDVKGTTKKKWRLKSRMKPAVWVEGGAHAREWISPAVAMWMIHALVETEKGLEADHEILKDADFYIMPVLNPDGYEHSHTHDRLWRKTRSRHGDDNDDYSSWLPWNWGGSDCVGVDPDRNWDYHWGEQDTSKDPCSEHYSGPHPFSEPETRAVSQYLAEHRDHIKVYISLHAYSQAWMMPSSHAHAPFADDGVLMEMGKLATAALADMYGTKYRVGTAAELRQPASGMSHDWAKARAGVKFSYHVDLRDSYGPYGFLLPGSQIVSTAKETWQAVKAIVDNLTPG